MTADRTEAAAKALVLYESGGCCDKWPTPCALCDCFRDENTGQRAEMDRQRARDALAAADAHDRANSIVRIRLDDELAEKIARLLYGVELTVGPPDRLAYDQARAVLDLLRNEALS